MADDKEDRRQRNLRDLEFYRSRVRPSATDLWRTIEKAGYHRGLALPEQAARTPGASMLRTPSSMAEAQEYLDNRIAAVEAEQTDGDAIWPLACALIVLIALAWTDNLDRVASAFLF
jgi:hypothetical protein